MRSRSATARSARRAQSMLSPAIEPEASTRIFRAIGPRSADGGTGTAPWSMARYTVNVVAEGK